MLRGKLVMHFSALFQHIIFVIHQRFLFIMLGTALGSIIALTISIYLPPVYQATALIRVNSAGAVAPDTSSDVFSTRALAISYAQLVTGPETLQEATYQISGLTLEQLQQSVSSSPLAETELIEIRSRANDDDQAITIANTIADVFIAQQASKEYQRLQDASNTVAESLTQVNIQIEESRQELATLQQNSADAETLARQQSQLDTYQSDYRALLSEYEELQGQKLQVNHFLSIAQYATLPATQLNLPPWSNALFTGGTLIFLLIALALFLDWLNITIQTEQDVITLASLKPLGALPWHSSIAHLLDHPTRTDYAGHAACDLLATHFLALRETERVLLVTGLQSGAGTTISTFSLAYALAQRGLRVLLIDANFRRPRLHMAFSLPHQSTLEDALLDVRACQQGPGFLSRTWLDGWKTTTPNLWFLPAGMPAQPTTLLKQHEFHILPQLLLDNLYYSDKLIDFILIDCAALAEGPDVLTLSPMADATLLVVKAGQERGSTIKTLQATLSRLGAPIAGVVVNQQRPGHRSYFYNRQSQAITGPEMIEKVPVASTTIVETQSQPDIFLPASASALLHLDAEELSPASTIQTEEFQATSRQAELLTSAILDHRPFSLPGISPEQRLLKRQSLTDTPMPQRVPQIAAAKETDEPVLDDDIDTTGNSSHLQFGPRLRVFGNSGPVDQVKLD